MERRSETAGNLPFFKLSQTDIELSFFERRVLHGHKEAETVALLKNLFLSRKNLKHMATQALLKIKRISEKFNTFPNVFYLETAYHLLLKDSRETKEERFIKRLFFIEMFNEHVLKKKMLEGQTEEIMRLVLKYLPTVLQAPSANFENVLNCLVFCTSFHLKTIRKGQEEGVAVEVLRSLLAKAVQLNINSPRTTNLIKKYLDLYKNQLRPHPLHF